MTCELCFPHWRTIFGLFRFLSKSKKGPYVPNLVRCPPNKVQVTLYRCALNTKTIDYLFYRTFVHIVKMSFAAGSNKLKGGSARPWEWQFFDSSFGPFSNLRTRKMRGFRVRQFWFFFFYDKNIPGFACVRKFECGPKMIQRHSRALTSL